MKTTGLQIALLSFAVLSQCSQKPDSIVRNEPYNSKTYDTVRLTVYLDSLIGLPIEVGSAKRALRLFESSFDKSVPSQCDEAFKSFLTFQASLTNQLNSKMYNDPDFEKLNSLVWADKSLHDSLGIEYEQELNENGWLLRSTEGTIYIARDTNPIRMTFFKYLSPATQTFFNQFELEENQILSEDGMLIINSNDLADRLGFWETFSKENPNNLFSDFALENIRYYRYYLLEGMDNTPAFDRFETKLFNKEFELTLNYYNSSYPKTESAKIFKNYQELLTEENMLLTPRVEEFIKKHRPWD